MQPDAKDMARLWDMLEAARSGLDAGFVGPERSLVQATRTGAAMLSCTDIYSKR